MQTVPFFTPQQFDPELVRSMSVAYRNLCRALGLTTKPDPATNLVAAKIVEIVQRPNAKTPTAIYLLAIEEFRDGK